MEKYLELKNLIEDIYKCNPEDFKNDIVRSTLIDLYPEYEGRLLESFCRMDAGWNLPILIMKLKESISREE